MVAGRVRGLLNRVAKRKWNQTEPGFDAGELCPLVFRSCRLFRITETHALFLTCTPFRPAMIIAGYKALIGSEDL